MNSPHDDEDKARPSSLIASNIGLLGSFVLFLLVVIKILAVAHFNLTSALAVTTSAGTGAVILGALLSSFSAVMVLVFLAIANLLIFRSLSRQDETILNVVLLLAFAILLAVFPWYMGPLFALALAAVFFQRFRDFLERSWQTLAKKGLLGKRARAVIARHDSITIHVQQRIAQSRVALEKSREAVEAHGEQSKKVEAAIQESYRRGQAYRAARWSLRRRRARRAMEKAILMAREKAAQLDAYQKASDEALAMAKEIQDEAGASLDEMEPLVVHASRSVIRIRGMMVLYILMLGLIALWSMISDRPWVPAERITLKGNTLLVAYVLDADSESVTVLRHDDRRVVMFSASLVVRRTICEEEEAGGSYYPFNASTIIEVVFGRSKQPNYPLCT